MRKKNKMLSENEKMYISHAFKAGHGYHEIAHRIQNVRSIMNRRAVFNEVEAYIKREGSL